MKTTLYHRRANGQIKVWTCWVKGRIVYTETGVLNGTMSQSFERMSTKSTGTGEERARQKYTRKVEIRKRKGYVANLDKVVTSIQVDDDTIDFDHFPRSFAPAKPIKKIDPEEMARWDAEGLLLVQRKRDGMRHRLVSDSKGRIKIYSSGNDDVTEHLKPLIADLTLPPSTLLDVELVVTDEFGNDAFNTVSGIARSLPDRAHRMIRQAEKEGCRVQLFAFDLLWERGVPVYRYPYEDRYLRLGIVVDRSLRKALRQMPLIDASLRKSLDLVKKFRWEGLVVWRKDQATQVQVNGSPKRVNCYKIKPIGEEDVVATGFRYGRGRNEKVVGKFDVALWNANLGVFVPMGRCGTGLDDATRAAAVHWQYPCVIQIEYDQRSDKGFRFPVFIRKRDDKKPSECVG